MIGLGAVLAAPLAAGAQQAGKVYRIGWLGITPPTLPAAQRIENALVEALRDRAFIEGQNVIFERRLFRKSGRSGGISTGYGGLTGSLCRKI